MIFLKTREKTSSKDCNMSTLSENFQEQYNRVQQQFKELTSVEKMYIAVELTKELPIAYRYFLSQFLYQTNNNLENNEMFLHTIHQANAPEILACLLSESEYKIISALRLYLPLVSATTTNKKLLEAYRKVLIHLDSKLSNPSNFSCTEQELIKHCQEIKFFIEKNPCLQELLNDIPQMNALASSTPTINNQENTDEISTQRHHQPLQRFPTVRPYQQASPPTTASPLMNFVSEGSNNTTISQQLLRTDANDSGVDLSEPCLTNSVQTLLPSQHSTIGRSHSASLALNNEEDNQSNHQIVIKSSSSPTPEQSNPTRPAFVPLTGVLSAPAPSHHSYYSDFGHQNSNYSHQQTRSTLPISDEDEEDSTNQFYPQLSSKPIENFYGDVDITENNNNNNNNRLRQFCSLRNRSARTNVNNTGNNSDSVSQYLGVDGVFGSIRNTFTQPNSGMRDVPKWLKNLRLHKYAFFFSQMTYDEMMNLTIDQLKEGRITDGACSKILLHIKKLKERQVLLQQCLIDIDNKQIDIKTVLQQLNDLMLTPIRALQPDQDNNDNEEDLPKLIMQLLEKVYQQLTSNTSSTTILSDMCNNLVGLFDRCYKHEAFSAVQRHKLLQWRGPLCNKLQTSGKIEFKSMQSSSSSSSSSTTRRTQLKPQTSMGSMNSTQITKPAIRTIKSIAPYYPTYQSTSVPLSRQHNSDLPSSNGNNSNSTETNLIRRPTKSPTLIFTPNNDTQDGITSSSSSNNHLSIVSSHSLQEQSSYHQTQSFITERSSIGSGNLRPSNNYMTSTPSRTNGGYLAANQHQLLTRKTSIDPYGETNSEDKTKLCKTYSDPNRVRFFHSIPSQQSSNHLQISSQPKTYHVTSNHYSSRQYLSRSQPSTNNANHLFEADLVTQSPIQKSYSDNKTPIYYENDENNNHAIITTTSSSSNDNKSHDVEYALKQRHNSTEFDTLCRQITESAISDDVIDEVINQKYSSDIHTTKSSSTNSSDTE